jgi:hypothetical protein
MSPIVQSNSSASGDITATVIDLSNTADAPRREVEKSRYKVLS